MLTPSTHSSMCHVSTSIPDSVSQGRVIQWVIWYFKIKEASDHSISGFLYQKERIDKFLIKEASDHSISGFLYQKERIDKLTLTH